MGEVGGWEKGAWEEKVWEEREREEREREEREREEGVWEEGVWEERVWEEWVTVAAGLQTGVVGGEGRGRPGWEEAMAGGKEGGSTAPFAAEGAEEAEAEEV